MNKYSDIIKNYYNGHEEDIRFTKSKGTAVEFITNMHYINKFANKGNKILELGAGTGAYSVELAKKGFAINAIELVQSNLDILNKKAEGIENLTAEQGDALDLSRFKDNTFDIVLSFGPMYHLFSEKDKMQAINEAIRVCKKDGILMFAYLTHSSIVWNFGVKQKQFAYLAASMTKDGKINDTPEEIFSTYFSEDFTKQFDGLRTKHIANVASDGLAYAFREYIDALTEEQYKLFLDWHLNTCERIDHQGLSSHMLYICKKI